MNSTQVIDLLKQLPPQVHINIMSKIKEDIHLFYACECLDCKLPFLYTQSDDTGIVQKSGTGKRPPAIPMIQLDCQKCKSPKRMSIVPITQEHFDLLKKTK